MSKIYKNGILKTTTDCCALCQISKINNETPKKEIQYVLDALKAEKEANREVGVSTGNGQTAVFSIISPGEYVLEQNLIDLGFIYTHTFERRKGYNERSSPLFRGDLKMYIKNL